jgi:hypothetical protein
MEGWHTPLMKKRMARLLWPTRLWPVFSDLLGSDARAMCWADIFTKRKFYRKSYGIYSFHMLYLVFAPHAWHYSTFLHDLRQLLTINNGFSYKYPLVFQELATLGLVRGCQNVPCCSWAALTLIMHDTYQFDASGGSGEDYLGTSNTETPYSSFFLGCLRFMEARNPGKTIGKYQENAARPNTSWDSVRSPLATPGRATISSR